MEPSAVEEALTALPDVREALVLPRVNGDKVTLDAFLLSEGTAQVDLASVRDVLAQLPPEWAPARMAVLSQFPVNSHGKIDTQALPVPQPLNRVGSDPESSRWRTMDRVVAAAFCGVLTIDEIGLSDSFFDLGGDSLTSVEVAARIGRELGRNVPGPSARAATVRAYAQKLSSLAAVATRDAHAGRPGLPVPRRCGSSRAPPVSSAPLCWRACSGAGVPSDALSGGLRRRTGPRGCVPLSANEPPANGPRSRSFQETWGRSISACRRAASPLSGVMSPTFCTAGHGSTWWCRTNRCMR